VVSATGVDLVGVAESLWGVSREEVAELR
jgi:hypothetical protein